MAMYLVHGSYTLDGVRGLLKDGGSKRRAVAEKAVQDLGGKLEAFYYAFGGQDVFAIFELPNNVSAVALTLAVNAGGGLQAHTTVLITPEEMDQATQMTTAYRPPGA